MQKHVESDFSTTWKSKAKDKEKLTTSHLSGETPTIMAKHLQGLTKSQLKNTGCANIISLASAGVLSTD
jgi:hypothetical protein